MRFQILAARLALAALLLAIAAAAIAVLGVRVGVLPYQTGLTLMVPAVAMGLIALICALAWMVTALRRNEGDARRVGLTAFLGALLFLWVPLHTLYTGLTTAPVNDVSSDPDNPPQFVALAKRAPGMNSPVFDNRTQIHFQGETGTPGYILHVFYPMWLIKPHVALSDKTLAEITSKWFWRDFETVKRMGWTIVAYDEKSGRIEAKSSSFWFGQVTDIVIRVEPAGTQGARVDVRAQSEYGKQDFGRNLMLLKRFFAALNP